MDGSWDVEEFGRHLSDIPIGKGPDHLTCAHFNKHSPSFEIESAQPTINIYHLHLQHWSDL